MQTIPVILFGVGGVGRALLRQISENRTVHAEQYGLTLQLLAVADSNGAIIASDEGLEDDAVQAVLAHKTAGGKLTEHALGSKYSDPLTIYEAVHHSISHSTIGQQPLILVDCTASATTVPALLAARERGDKVVLANKKPLTMQQEVYDRLTRAGTTATSPRALGAARWETTCGAALPVICTLNRLHASGDTVRRIAGTFSGTLGYVMTGLQAEKPFSQIVREAHQLGYTEPDPRDDLGGVDVARKALILARGLGWRMELAQVQVTGLYPAAMDALSVAAFMVALPTLDEHFAQQVAAAKQQGKVLRYAATVEGNAEAPTLTVGPTLVEAGSPLGRLSGTDNLVEFYTRWYTPNPLVVQGRGAGVEATASGVLADIVELGSR